VLLLICYNVHAVIIKIFFSMSKTGEGGGAIAAWLPHLCRSATVLISLDTVTDVSLEDSGNYTCEVRGHGSVVSASVTHYIFVRG